MASFEWDCMCSFDRAVWAPFFSSTVSVSFKLSHLFQVSNTHSLPKFMDGCKCVNSNFSLILWVLISFNQFLTLSHSLSFARRESSIGEWHEVINLTEYLLNEHLPTYNYFGKLMKWKLEICVLMKCTLFFCVVWHFCTRIHSIHKFGWWGHFPKLISIAMRNVIETMANKKEEKWRKDEEEREKKEWNSQRWTN